MIEREQHNLELAKSYLEGAKIELKTKKRRIIKKRALQSLEKNRLIINKLYLKYNNLIAIEQNNYDKAQIKSFIKII